MGNWTVIFIILVLIPFAGNGQEGEWLLNKDNVFTSISSGHFILHSFDGHLTMKTKLDILKERESAYMEIADFFGLKPDLAINIFLFRDEQVKYNLTGHRGLGWGFKNNMLNEAGKPENPY